MTEGGIGRRAGLGAKMCLRRLHALSSTSTTGEKEKKGKARELMAPTNGQIDTVTPPKKAHDIDALITQELLTIYSRGERRAILK